MNSLNSNKPILQKKPDAVITSKPTPNLSNKLLQAKKITPLFLELSLKPTKMFSLMIIFVSKKLWKKSKKSTIILMHLNQLNKIMKYRGISQM